MVRLHDEHEHLPAHLRLRLHGLRAGRRRWSRGSPSGSARSTAPTTSGGSTRARPRGSAAWRWRSALASAILLTYLGGSLRPGRASGDWLALGQWPVLLAAS